MNLLVEAFLDNNFGDDLFVSVLTEHFRTHKIFLLHTESKGHNLASRLSCDNLEMITSEEAEECSSIFEAYIFVGGDFYPPAHHYNDRQRRADLVRANGGKVIILGCSLYEEYPDNTFDPAKRLFESADLVTFRDVISYEKCRKLAPKAPAFLSTDMAFASTAIRKHAKSREGKIQNLGISVRERINSRLDGSYDRFCDQIISIAESHLRASQDNRVTLLALSTGEWNDFGTAALIKSRMEAELQNRVSLCGYFDSLSAFVDQVDTLDALVCTRFHSLCLALMLGKPFVPICYEIKVENLLRTLGYEGLLIGYGDEVAADQVLASLTSNSLDARKEADYYAMAKDFFVLCDAVLLGDDSIEVLDSEQLPEVPPNVNRARESASADKDKDKVATKKLQKHFVFEDVQTKGPLDQREQQLVDENKRLRNRVTRVEAQLRENYRKNEAWILEKQEVVYQVGNLLRIGRQIEGSRANKIAHLVRRTTNQLIKGSFRDKRDYLSWLLRRSRNGVLNRNHDHNPIYQMLIPIASLHSRLKGESFSFGMESGTNNIGYLVNDGEYQPETIMELRKALAAYSGELVCVVPSVIDFDIELFQRPQQIALALSEMGIMTIYMTPNYRDGVQGIRRLHQNAVLVPMETTVETVLSLVADAQKRSAFQLYSTDSRMTPLDVQRYQRLSDFFVYEYIDEIHEDITGAVPSFVMNRHRMILEDLNCYVVSTASKLHDEVVSARGGERNCLLSSNGVDTSHFSEYGVVRGLSLPPDFRAVVRKHKPIVGYYGAIATWFDFDLVSRAARSCKDLEFVIIGPLYSKSVAKHIRELGRQSNITICDPVDYRILPTVASHFTAATIPFVVNDITKSTSPIKVFEYMALGKPTVTTAMPECRKYPVYVAESEEEYIRMLRCAIEDASNPMKTELLVDCARDNSWVEKAKDVIRPFIGKAQ